MIVLKIVLVLACTLSVLALLGVTLVAYSRRTDRRFFGGVNILTGWWLLLPTRASQLSEADAGLVWGARAALVAAWAFAIAAYKVGG